jgi:hypothetical protein
VALRLGATVADLVTEIARRTPSLRGNARAASAVRLVHGGLDIAALDPLTRLNRIGLDGGGGGLRDGAKVFLYLRGGQGSARLTEALECRGVGKADAVSEEAWAMRTWLCVSELGPGSAPHADENEHAEPLECGSFDDLLCEAVADSERLCRLRMHRCIEANRDACYPMRKERMVDYSTYRSLGMDGPPLDKPSPSIDAVFLSKAARGIKALEYEPGSHASTVIGCGCLPRLARGGSVEGRACELLRAAGGSAGHCRPLLARAAR